MFLNESKSQNMVLNRNLSDPRCQFLSVDAFTKVMLIVH
jgi:hypothetical protein